MDAKTHRGEARLDVRHVHFERWMATSGRPPVGDAPRVDGDAALSGVADALASLGRFVRAQRITLARVTPGRLRAPLARALKDAAR